MGRGDGHNRAGQAKNLLYGPRPTGPGPTEIEEEAAPETAKNLPSAPESVLETLQALPIDDFKKRGMQTITIGYDGYGDSGDVHSINVQPQGELTDKEDSLLRDLAFGLLESRHGGWEINEGSNGSVKLDLEKGSIEHDHYTNYIAQDHDLDEMSLD